MIQIIKDLLLEMRIQLALNRMLRETNRFRQRDYADQMTSLIHQRSDRRMRQMGKRMGL